MPWIPSPMSPSPGMPELPEVETTRRLLEPIMVGRRVDAIDVDHPRAVRHQANPADFTDEALGTPHPRRGAARQIPPHRARRRSDLGLASGDVRSHGSAAIRRGRPVAALPGGDRPELRGRGALSSILGPSGTPRSSAPRSSLRPASPGLDPMPCSPCPTSPVLTGSLQGRRAPIKALLLDQRIIAGVGNIYADEALHRARISPHRAGGSLDRDDVGRLRRAIKVTLQAGLAAGGTSLNDMAYLLPDGRAGEFQVRLRAYGREGETCRRGDGTIRRDVVGGRSSYWCPACQR